ncbi:hypothetical protein RKD05_002247 [Microbacterium sp. SLBN-111]
MHDRTPLIEMRIDRFVRERLVPAVYRTRHPLTVTAWEAPGEPVPFAEAAAADYRPFAVGTPWGRAWGTTLVRRPGRGPGRVARRRRCAPRRNHRRARHRPGFHRRAERLPVRGAGVEP